MQTVYNSNKFEVRKYGTELTYLLLDHASGECVAFEPPRSAALADALLDGDNIEMTDIYLEGVMVLLRHYGEIA